MFGSYFKTTFYNFKDEFQNVFVYMTSATGDYFFMPDETHLWWHGFEENKFPRKILRLIPKAEQVSDPIMRRKTTYFTGWQKF